MGLMLVFQNMWGMIGSNIVKYCFYLCIVGEMGGKDFVFVYLFLDVEQFCVVFVCGVFEYQGQKCLVVLCVYILKLFWLVVCDGVVDYVSQIVMGFFMDFCNFMGVVIDENLFDNIDSYLQDVNGFGYEVIIGGKGDKLIGYFVELMVVCLDDFKLCLMEEEIFGLVFMFFVYEDSQFEEMLQFCDMMSDYVFIGVIFVCECGEIELMVVVLCYFVGNFYINDKLIGVVVGQQLFGGSCVFGINDKVGLVFNFMCWMLLCLIKEIFVGLCSVGYLYMGEEQIEFLW